MKIKDGMTASVQTIAPDASLKNAAKLFDERRIGGAPVVDGEGNVVGVITEADILVKERAEQPARGWKKLFGGGPSSELAAKAEARSVREAMSTPPITVDARWQMSDAAELMLEHGVNRLPVVENGTLVGIITRHDLVRAFARSDAEIERDIREEAFRGLMFSEELQLRVENGEVTLRGEVDSAFDASVIPNLVRRVPGVVGVDSELTAWDTEKQRKVVVAERRG